MFFYVVNFLLRFIIIIVPILRILFILVKVKCFTLFVYVNLSPKWVIDLLNYRNKLNL